MAGNKPAPTVSCVGTAPVCGPTHADPAQRAPPPTDPRDLPRRAHPRPGRAAPRSASTRSSPSCRPTTPSGPWPPPWPTSRPAAWMRSCSWTTAAPTARWQVAREMGLTVIVHPENRGYGGNQKTCYRYALEHGADVVVMIHPDYQYDARVIPHAVGLIELGICDVVLGSRIRSPAGGAAVRHAVVEVLHQPGADVRRERGPGAEPGRLPQRVPRLPPQRAGDDPVRAELGRLRLRHAVPGPGGPLRLPARRPAGAGARTSPRRAASTSAARRCTGSAPWPRWRASGCTACGCGAPGSSRRNRFTTETQRAQSRQEAIKDTSQRADCL